jgi:phosphatidylglycerophosphate synthase
VAGFLLASRRRAREVRADRPALAAQARRWVALGALPWLAIGAGAAPWRQRGARAAARRQRAGCAGLAWWLCCGLMLDWHLGMWETDDAQARRLDAADALTLGRAWLVPLAFTTPTPGVCLLAAVSDALDGPLARRRGATRAGRDLEGLVDACFTVAALAGARREGLVPGWAAGAEAVRISVGILYAVGSYFLAAEPPERSLIGAARPLSVARAGGLVIALAGRRRAGASILAAGALASALITIRAGSIR